MPEASSLSFLLLPLAVAAGWLLATRFRSPEESNSVNPDYLRGLQYLVNEEADKAIEIFINIAGIDNETVETHLALGNLFRKQGQVDRALRLHQNLVARPNLDARHRNQARYELARDYLTAGVFDRAEALLNDLVRQGVFLEKSLRGLIRIYEQERDWDKALQMTRQLESAIGTKLPAEMAQYHCELAAQASARKDFRLASQQTRKALGEDRNCVRAMILEGDNLFAADKYRQAEKMFQRAIRARPDLSAEILPKLEKCFVKRGAPEEWASALSEISRSHPSVPTHVAIARLHVDGGRMDEAIHYLAGELENSPSWRLFAELLRLAEQDDDPRFAGLEELKKALHSMLAASPDYQCEHCGFTGRYLHWQCPSCRRWESQRALSDVITSGPVAAPGG